MYASLRWRSGAQGLRHTSDINYVVATKYGQKSQSAKACGDATTCQRSSSRKYLCVEASATSSRLQLSGSPSLLMLESESGRSLGKSGQCLHLCMYILIPEELEVAIGVCNDLLNFGS